MKENIMVVKNQENYDYVTTMNTKIIISGLLVILALSSIVLVFNIFSIGMSISNAVASSSMFFMLGFLLVMIVSNIYCAYKLFPDLVNKYKNK